MFLIKELILQDVINSMKFVLDDKQLRKLQFILYDKLKGINLYQEETGLEDHVSNNPTKKIKKIKCEHRVKKPFTEEEIEVIRDNCKNKRDLAIVDLLISTGMRVGELVLLNIDDIDFANGQCIVFGKGSRERETYLNAKAKIHIKEYISYRTDSNKALFVSLKKPHNRLSISGIESMIRQLGKKANISRAYPHKFRRTAATTAINRGMPIEQVQALLGHKQIDTTLKYAIVNQRNVKNSHEKYLT